MSIKGIDNSQLLSQMKAMAQAAGIEPAAAQGGFKTETVSNNFSNLLVRAIDNVNSAQQESSMLAGKIETGDGGASLVKAMIASQKANISFQATIQVRNKVAAAYHEIMNMPI